jgi:hypothetical protein
MLVYINTPGPALLSLDAPSPISFDGIQNFVEVLEFGAETSHTLCLQLQSLGTLQSSGRSVSTELR